MTYTERAERISALAASLRADEAERDRLKAKADESLARFHGAVREFAKRAYGDAETFSGAQAGTGRASG
jgi:hypothetical protein